MEQTPIISIILPVYNGERFVETAINSILRQPSFNLIETIIINDGSTDDTVEICEKFSGEFKGIRLINQSNQGVMKSRNRAIREATGKYLLFLDQDDALIDNCFNSNTMHLIETYYEKGTDLICTPQIKGNASLEILSEVCFEEEGEYFSEDTVFNKINEYYAFHFILFNKKFILEKNLWFWENSSYDKDAMFWEMAVVRACRIVLNNKLRFYIFRDNPDSVSHNWESIEFYRDLFKFNNFLLKEANYDVGLYHYIMPKMCYHYWRFSVWYFLRYYNKRRFLEISNQFDLYKDIKANYKNKVEYFTEELDMVFNQLDRWRRMFVKTRLRRWLQRKTMR